MQHLPTALLTFIAVAIASYLVGGHVHSSARAPQPQRSAVHLVPTGTVAPEVCTGQGPVRQVYRTGSVYRATCASGIIVLVAAR